MTPPPTSAAPNNVPTAPVTGDPGQHKLWAIVGYIIPILFFIPLISDAKHNAFAKFHANQQLNLLLLWVAINVIAIIPLLGWLVFMVGAIAGLVFMIMGIMNAASGKMKELPLIGKFALIK